MSNLLGLENERTSTGEYDNATGPDPELPARIARGANWFYWIAGLSLINSAAFLVGANFHFLAGLGITEIADAVIEASIQEGAPSAIKAVSVIFDLIVVVGFALTGYFSNKYFQTVFIAGIVIYIFDGLIVLLLGDYLMAGFHAFALYGLIRGFIALREFKRTSAVVAVAQAEHLPPPPPPTV
ncbi:MAG: hypothetical protein WBO10_11560 [Pyrinomonadaceae bacterium]